MKEFEGKVVLITGASSGIGRAVAEHVADRGARVILNYFSNEDGVMQAVQSIQEKGGHCVAIRADVTKKAEVEAMVEKAREAFGSVDVLVNNAGAAIRRSSFLEISEKLWDQTYALNVKSILFCSQCVAKDMIERKEGKIINVSSIAARLGGGGDSIHYASSKGAVETMTIGMAKEFAPYGILVNGVAPGVVDTPFQVKYSSKERLERVVAGTPLKRVGKAEEIAELIGFLISDRANFICGEIITISGGR